MGNKNKNKKETVPRTSAKNPKLIEERILFKKSQTRLMQEIALKHQKETEIALNEILEDEGLIDKMKNAERTTMISGFAGIILFKKKKK